MSKQHVLALTLALLASACATNTTGTVPGLGTGDDRLAAEKSPTTMIRVGDATRAGGDPGSAVALYRRAHELAPKDPVPLNRLGATFVQLRAYTEAAEAYRQAIELAPDDVEARGGYAALLLTIDKPALAVTHLDVALAKSQEPRLYNLMGVANDLLGLHDVAQRNYAEGLRLAANNAPLRNNLGLSQALAGDFTAAIATLSAAAASPDATPRTRQNLALVYGLAGDYDKAAAVARTDLDESSVRSNLAYYTLLRGMDERARAAAIIGGHAPPAAVANPPQAADLAAETPPQAAPTASVDAAPLPAPSPSASSSPAPSPATPTIAEKPASAPHSLIAKRPPRAPASVALKTEKPAVEPPPPASMPQVAAKDAAPAAEPPVAGASPESTAPASPPQAAEPPVASAAPPASPPSESAPSATAQPVPEKPTEQVATAAEPPAPQEQATAPVDSGPQAPQQQTASTEPPAAEPSPAAPSAAPAKHPSAPRSGGRFFVQVGAFHDPARAHRLCDDLAAKGYELAVSTAPARGWFFCRSTAASDHAEASAAAERLRSAENTPALLIPASLAVKE
jgi:Flp pilus assembly protein TadD